MVSANHETGEVKFEGDIHDWACDIAMLLRDFRHLVAEKGSAKLADKLYDEVVKNAVMTKEEIIADIDKRYGGIENMLREALIQAYVAKDDAMLKKIGDFIELIKEETEK